MRLLITRGRGRHPHLAVDDSSARACSGRVSHGLRGLPQVRLDRLPRMADFGPWAAACETTLARRHIRAGLGAARGTHAATGSASMESAIAALRLAGPFRKALGLPSQLAWGYDDNVLLFKPFLLQNFR